MLTILILILLLLLILFLILILLLLLLSLADTRRSAMGEDAKRSKSKSWIKIMKRIKSKSKIKSRTGFANHPLGPLPGWRL